MKRSQKAVTIAIAAAVVVFGLGAAAMPQLPTLSTRSSGDAALEAEVRERLNELPGVRDRVVVAVIDGGDVRAAYFGATDTSEFEIGSVTKTVTASLLAEAISRGEVEAGTALGSLLDLGSSEAASITLEELATHSSGLPRLALGPLDLVRVLLAQYTASDPYGATVEELVASAREIELGEKTYAYSNLGYALLGQALAAAAGTDYPSLARERVFEPLGMDLTFAPTSISDLEPDASSGFTESGRASDPWTLGADAPAGSVRSTLPDMIAYLRGQLDGSAPGVAATEPIAPAGETSEIGYAWHTTGTITWHNGTTGGFSSWVGFDSAADRAVVILNSTASSVDELGFALMEGK